MDAGPATTSPRPAETKAVGVRHILPKQEILVFCAWLRMMWRPCVFLLVGMVFPCLFPRGANAQILRIGPFDFYANTFASIAYNSNVDESYPEEVEPGYQEGDFYYLLGFNVRTDTLHIRPNLRLNLNAGMSWEDYFERDDLDVTTYNVALNLQGNLLNQFAFGVNAMSEFTTEAEKDTYIPGGAKRDPHEIDTLDTFLNWRHQKLRVETKATYTRERHDKEEFKEGGDQDETVLFAGAYLDVFSWGSIYYSVEKTDTDYVYGEDTTEIVKNFGLQGAIPLTWIPHPHITYSIGFESEDSDADPEKDATWEPAHTIRAEDSLQIGTSLSLAGYVQWENKVYDDDVTLTYALSLKQQINPRMVHTISFEQEPEATFGSNQDTKKTTTAYQLDIRDILIRDLSFSFMAEYLEEEPLESDANTEYTTTWGVSLSHSRRLSRRLSRSLAYIYTWENSNFHDDGANEVHEIIYTLNYAFD